MTGAAPPQELQELPQELHGLPQELQGLPHEPHESKVTTGLQQYGAVWTGMGDPRCRQSHDWQPPTPAARSIKAAKTSILFILAISDPALPALREAIDRQLYNTSLDVQTQRVDFFHRFPWDCPRPTFLERRGGVIPYKRMEGPSR